MWLIDHQLADPIDINMVSIDRLVFRWSRFSSIVYTRVSADPAVCQAAKFPQTGEQGVYFTLCRGSSFKFTTTAENYKTESFHLRFVVLSRGTSVDFGTSSLSSSSNHLIRPSYFGHMPETIRRGVSLVLINKDTFNAYIKFNYTHLIYWISSNKWHKKL